MFYCCRFLFGSIGKTKTEKKIRCLLSLLVRAIYSHGRFIFLFIFFLSLLTRVFMIKLWVLWYAFYVFWRGLKGLLAYRACDFLACIYMDLVNLTIFEYIYPHR